MPNPNLTIRTFFIAVPQASEETLMAFGGSKPAHQASADAWLEPGVALSGGRELSTSAALWRWDAARCGLAGSPEVRFRRDRLPLPPRKDTAGSGARRVRIQVHCISVPLLLILRFYC